MQTKTLSPKQALNKAYQRQKPFRNEFNIFKENLLKLLNELNPKESEEHNKNYVAKFFENSFYSGNLVNTSGKIDLVIYLGKDTKIKVGVIGEVKAPTEKNDMPSKDNLNVKAMHQVILYYLRERIEEKNDDIKNIFITNGYQWFIFDAKLFEKLFYKSSELVKRYKAWAADKKVSSNTDHFYKEIAADYLNNLDAEIEFVHFDLRMYERELKSKSGNETKLISLFKIFSKPFLLNEQFTNDSNSLDKSFYNELLYIIGLEEVKEGSKKLIRRKNEEKREPGAIIENTIEKLKSKDTVTYFNDAERFGEDDEEKLFNIALQLNITWINRILFLKLLEAQLVNYHQGNTDYKFLDTKIIAEYDDLDELFHEVLARKLNERSKTVREKFKKIPYLNSSLFERSELERKTISIDSLKDRFRITVHSSTVLKDEKDNRFKGELSTLNYLLKFLDAYDFSTESTGEEIQEEGKSLINASVLGLIFEKINGYKEGSFFTPGFITMYMSCETLRRAVVQKFNDVLKSSYKNFDELKSELDRTKEGREKANEIINSLKVCDPAVGSGHFLVSVLNEIITIKSELGVLCYRDGSRVQNYSVEIQNDELIITDVETEDIFKYHLNQKGNVIDELQKLQEAVFHEKQTIIENCLFGVDINPNSVNICRLRLWIELLKNSFYTKKSGYKELETLPNIDINIKQGNSLISRFGLGDQVFRKGDRTSLELYKINVKLYKNADDRDKRRELKDSIDRIREKIKGIYVDPLKEEKKKLRNMQKELDDLNTQISGFEDEKLEEKKEKLEKKIDKLVENVIKQEEENELIYRDAFEWRFEFPEVLDEEGSFVGFDVVIGNPPYISHDKIEGKSFIAKHFESYEPFADLYCYFIERSISLSHKSTLIALITSNSFLRAEYGKPLRDLILDKSSISQIINTNDTQVFEDAIVNTVVMLLEIGDKDQEALVVNRSYDFRSDFLEFVNTNKLIYQQEDFNTVSWNLVKPSELKIGEKIKLAGKSLVELGTQINLGLATGANNVFIIDEVKRNELIKRDPKNKDILKPILRGKDIVKYSYRTPNNYIILTRNEINVNKEFPSLIHYFEQFGEKFKQRGAKGKHWSNLRACSFFDDFKNEKIIWIELSDENRFALCKDEIYLLNSAYFLLPPKEFESLYLLGILNSRLIKFYMILIANTSGMGTTRWINIYVREFPIPVVSYEKQKPIIAVVDQILMSKKENPEADTSALEREIDELVYKLYGLTEEEIRIVEGGVG
ncbi:putative type iis restriction/modification enzyme [hydrocarbon metagenome]|uniref:site-specific DNA-methyltransferase (adenine-specific) n=1 Tax=hydrocarbon metagenome TaxID=938273 RepID=A0A0W8G1E1_9ZZZZ